MTFPKYILIMKIGPFCGFSLEEIIDIKTKEQAAIGKFFLGYSGVFCHPKRVSEFIKLAKADHGISIRDLIKKPLYKWFFNLQSFKLFLSRNH